MGLRVLVVPDKFKGTITALQAAESLTRGWKAARPEDDLELLPMSDGGDGFGDILSSLLGAGQQIVTTVDAARRPCQAIWWWHESSATAVIESARMVGLAMLPRGQFHPFALDTRGLAPALQAAAKLGARRCLMGIGGSATNDGGFGLALGLGWRFLDRHGHAIQEWIQLERLEWISPPASALGIEEWVVAVDVQNPLLGPQGCSHVFGPQKGLSEEDFAPADHALGRLAKIATQHLGYDAAVEPGAGAAGGLGFGLRAFCGGRLAPGFELFAEFAELDRKLAQADLVLTGEGALDEQTLMGKGVGELATWCQRRKVPCLAFAGVIKQPEKARVLFAAAHALTPDFVSRERAMTDTARCLAELAARAAREWRA